MSKKAQPVTRLVTVQAPAPRPPRKRANPPLVGSNIVQFAQDICAATNPFCDESRGSKWPDASSAQTLSVPVRQRVNLTTDADGEVTKVFIANYSVGILNYGTVSGSATLTGNATNYAPVFASADSVRLVSGGIKITPITSATNSQGIINVIELPSTEACQTEYFNVVTTTKNFPTYESLPLKSDKSIFSIMRPSGPQSREFFDIYTDVTMATNLSTHDWSSICVNITGGAFSTVVAVVDIYMNFEVTVQTSSELGFLTTRAPGLDPRVLRASTAITLDTGTYVGSNYSVDQTIMAKAFGYLKSAGSFLYTNRKTIGRLGIAGAQAYSGDVGGAGMTLGGVAANHMIMDVD